MSGVYSRRTYGIDASELDDCERLTDMLVQRVRILERRALERRLDALEQHPAAFNRQ